jgi:hypothetical protein
MKQRTDAIAATDEKLQQFLMWINEKSLSVSVPYKPLVIRAFYVAVAFSRNLGFHYDHDRSRDIALAFNLDVYLSLDFDIVLDFNLGRLLARACDFDNAVTEHDYEMILHIDNDLYERFASVFALSLPLELRQALEQVKEQRHQRGYNIFSPMWWQPNKSLIKRLRDVMIKHRNIGHNWQFSQEQKELLKQYYDANKLLVDCLNSSCNVTPEVQQEIENTLLLPIAEIQKRGSCQDK